MKYGETPAGQKRLPRHCETGLSKNCLDQRAAHKKISNFGMEKCK